MRVCLILLATIAAVEGGNVLKVFVLSGQSNMEGKGVVYTPGGKINGSLAWQLDVDHSYLPVCSTMGPNPRVGCRAEAANFSGLFTGPKGSNATNATDWVSFPNVYAAYKGSHDRNGTMTVGYGFKTNWIGPEYGFGKTMGEYFADNGGNQVLVLKVCWGGTALETDWRPPSSGGTTGWCYSNYTKIVHEALEKGLEKLVPGFSYSADKYEIAGFGWHQGWNDGCSQKPVDDYETNLANMIKDIRKEFNVPKAPWSIALSGFGGWGQANGRRLGIMAGQYNVTQHQDLGTGTIAAVETRGFFRSFAETHGAINQGYHWFGNAETYFYLGTAMGEAMKHELGGTWKQPYINTSVPHSDAIVDEGFDGC
jgi:alpha-galactosidase